VLTRVLMIAGEASGDMHGAGVARALRVRRPEIDLYGIGGDAMQREGVELIFHCSRLSFMGFVEVLRNLPTVMRVERTLVRLLERRRPDVVVLIDYPGFNLRFARKAKARGIKVLYYISPQVWAWNKKRVKTIKEVVDRIKVVFPFEEEIYRAEGVDVEFVGHPIVERIGASCIRQAFFQRNRLDPSRKLLGLFPGSRRQEVERILPLVLEAAEELRTGRPLQVAIGVAPNLGADLVRSHIPGDAQVTLVENGTYDLMQYCDAAVVTSGTATLETGWFGTPMVVVYRTSQTSFALGRMLVDVPYIGLVNIVAGRKVVPELVQHEMTRENLVREVAPLLDDPARGNAMRRELAVIKSKLGGPGASDRVALGIIGLGESA
jgi:lipid-A-disaccharide synthase